MLKGRHMIPNIFIINATYQLVSSKQAQEIEVAKFTPVTTHKQTAVSSQVTAIKLKRLADLKARHTTPELGLPKANSSH